MGAFDGFALSIRGYSHIKENIARQDCAVIYADPDGWAMAAVSDGHGGVDYFRSHIGSRFAVESALLTIKECMRKKDVFFETLRGPNADEQFRRLKSSIINNWNTLVDAFHEDPQGFGWDSLETLPTRPAGEPDPDSPVEEGIDLEWELQWIEENAVIIKEEHPERLYGCTLLAAVMTPELCFSVQIGDGCCVIVFPDGQAAPMIPFDDGKPSNVTDSLCEWAALGKFKHALYIPGQDEAADDETVQESVLAAEYPPEYAPEAVTDVAVTAAGEFTVEREPEESAAVPGDHMTALAANESVTEPGPEETAAVPYERTEERDHALLRCMQKYTPGRVKYESGYCAIERADECSNESIVELPPEETGTTIEREIISLDDMTAFPAGILVSTDGLFNSFVDIEDFLNFNRRVLSRMAPSVRVAFREELEEHLHERSRMGSYDDISIALVFDEEIDFEAVGPVQR